MGYEKLNLKDGTTLTEEHLLHIEDGISKCPQAWSEGEGGLVEVYPVTSLTYVEDEGMAISTDILFGVADLADGDEVTVTYNGVDYVCTAQEYVQEGVVMALGLGDFEAISTGVPTGSYPFAAMLMSAEASEMMGGIGIMLLPCDGATSVSFGIKKSSETVHKLDNKYLDLEWLPTKKVVLTTVLPETTIDTTSSVPVPVSDLSIEAFPAGGKAVVTFDGVEYECTVKVDGGTAGYFGNLSLFGTSGADTGEPFFFLNNGNEWRAWTSVQAAHTVMVEEQKTVYNKIPDAFLPDSAAFMSAVDAGTIETNSQGDLSVDVSALQTAIEKGQKAIVRVHVNLTKSSGGGQPTWVDAVFNGERNGSSLDEGIHPHFSTLITCLGALFAVEVDLHWSYASVRVTRIYEAT